MQVINFNTGYSHLQKKKSLPVPQLPGFLSVTNWYVVIPLHHPTSAASWHWMRQYYIHCSAHILQFIWNMVTWNMCHNVNQPTATFNAYENGGAYAVCIHPPVCTTCTVYRAFYSHCIGLLLLLLLLLLHHLPLQAHFDRHSHAYCSNSGRSNNLCGCCSCPGGRVLRGHR